MTTSLAKWLTTGFSFSLVLLNIACVLNTLGMASIRLASLFGAQHMLKGDKNAMMEKDLKRALEDVAKELSITK